MLDLGHLEPAIFGVFSRDLPKRNTVEYQTYAALRPGREVAWEFTPSECTILGLLA